MMESKYLKTRGAALAIYSLLCLDVFGSTAWKPENGVSEFFECEGIRYGITSRDSTSEIKDVVITMYDSISRPAGDIVIPSEVRHNGMSYPVISIGDSTFYKCSGLKSVSVPTTAESIGISAFEECDNLVSVKMPSESVKSISAHAFFGCPKLSEIILPASLESIGYAFSNCSSILTMHVPAKLENIVSGPFKGCFNLTAITCDDDNPYFSAEDGVLFSKNKDKIIEVPTGKKDVDNMLIPSSVKEIGGHAFEYCEYLTHIRVPDNVLLQTYCFRFCQNLKKVILNDDLTQIPAWSFDSCDSMEEIVLGEKVRFIGDYAFMHCNSLKRMYVKNPTPPAWYVYEFRFDLFDFTTYYPSIPEEVWDNATLFIPSGTLQTYRKAFGWEKFKDILEYDFSAVDEIDMQQADIRIEDGSIVVTGNDENIPVEVFTTSGNKVYSGHDSIISSLPHGMYIVKVGPTTRRVIL